VLFLESYGCDFSSKRRLNSKELRQITAQHRAMLGSSKRSELTRQDVHRKERSCGMGASSLLQEGDSLEERNRGKPKGHPLVVIS